MNEIKLTVADIQTGDVVRTDEYGWAQWDGETWRAVGPYVVAPDAQDTPTLWYLTDLQAAPVYITNKRVMDNENEALWPALVAQFHADTSRTAVS